MIQNISIIGGDLRLLYLAEMLTKENYKIKVYGLDKIDNIKICNTLEEAVIDNDVIISSIPFSKDGIHLNMPLSNKKITIKDFFDKIQNKTLIAGSIKDDIINLAKINNIKIIDLMKDQKLAINNTVATAEGTIKIAIEETEKAIFNSNVLVLGFGKVGKIVAERFKGLKANVYCEARKEEDIAWINVYGYQSVYLEDLKKYINNFDIIINTIPAKILNEKELKMIKKDCLIIDLASNPGGIDFEKAEEFGIKVIHELGIPGKIAPYTSAELIKEIIEKIIN